MSGIDIAEEVTASQLEALAGGELLKAEVHVTLSLSHSLSLSLSLSLLFLPTHHSLFILFHAIVCILLSSS